jgi:hypothetical protein
MPPEMGACDARVDEQSRLVKGNAVPDEMNSEKYQWDQKRREATRGLPGW